VRAPGGLSVRCESVTHAYAAEGDAVLALDGVDLEIGAGETVALLGPSGSGKSTLLALLAGLLRPTAGRLCVGSHDVHRMTERELLGMRSLDVGIVLQNPGRNLLAYASALDNVAFAQLAGRQRRRSPSRSAMALLETLGLAAVAGARAGLLSGGEQQRLALAVGLANGAGLLLADEPTSQLDGANRDSVVSLFQAANVEFGTTLVVVTHDPEIGRALDRTVGLRDGRVRTDLTLDPGRPPAAGRRSAPHR